MQNHDVFDVIERYGYPTSRCTILWLGVCESHSFGFTHECTHAGCRGVPPDFFASYAAAGRRNGTQRVSMLPLPDRSTAGTWVCLNFCQLACIDWPTTSSNCTCCCRSN